MDPMPLNELPHARARWILLALMVAIYLVFGIIHIATPDPFLPIMPDWVPFPRERGDRHGRLRDRRGRRPSGAAHALARRCDAGALCRLRLSGQPQARLRSRRRPATAEQLVVSRPAAGLSAGVRVVVAVLRGRDRLAVAGGGAD